MLLTKLVDISRGKLVSVPTAKSVDVSRSSLNLTLRKKENERIVRENERFA